MNHDQCRRTPKFKAAGQNLYMTMNNPDYGDVKQAIRNAVKAWFDENKKMSDKSEINKFTGKNLMATGHFTQLVWASANRIGCSIMKYVGNNWHTILIGCNYSCGNMMGKMESKKKKLRNKFICVHVFFK